MKLSEFEKKSLALQAAAYREYLLTDQAAAFCGVSVAQFNAKAAEHGLKSVMVMGKVQYRKSDLRMLFENEFQLISQFN